MSSILSGFFFLFLCFTIIFVIFFPFLFSVQYFSLAFLFAQLHERVPQVVYVVWVHLWCGFGILSIVFSYHYTNANDFTNHWGLLYMNRWCNEMVVNDDALFPFCFLHFCMALYCRHYTKYRFTFVMLLSIKQFSGQIYGIIGWHPPMFYHSALVEQAFASSIWFSTVSYFDGCLMPFHRNDKTHGFNICRK